MSNLKESALNYARNGFKVFPLAPNSKSKQVLKSWKNEATSDIKQVKKWWDTNPEYNIGIVTGNGLLVVDIDVKHNAKGLESINKYGHNFPTTAKVKTPSNGYHLYYFVNGDFKNKINLYPGIDIKSTNGYIVAPPSIINEHKYEWVNNEPINDANSFVYEFLNGTDKEKVKQDIIPVNIEGEILQGARNDTLFKLASSLQAKGLSDNAILSAMYQENKSKCNPPLKIDEVKSIYNSVKERYEKGTSSYIKTPKQLSLEVTNMAEVEEKEAQWLIPDFIPKGVISVVAGDGGVGKTFFWCDLVASISSGKPTFFENRYLIGERNSDKVMYFSSEDDMQVTLKRRLRLSGADMNNIITIPIGDDRFKEVKYNSQFLEDLIAYHSPVLVVFDPLQGFIPNNINMGYRNQMRDVLSPLAGLGEKYGVTPVIMAHTNKKENSFGRNRLSDSSDIWDIARSVFIIGHTGEDDLRYLSHEKCNYGPLQDTVLFSIDDGAITYRGDTTKKDRDFMTMKAYSHKNKGAKDDTKDFIIDQLKEHDGVMENQELLEYAKACGYSQRTFERVKADLKKQKVIDVNVQGFGKDKTTKISLHIKEG